MKYIKSYETVDFAKIKRGYYIILHSIHSELNDFVSHNIGKIVGKSNGECFGQTFSACEKTICAKYPH